MRIKSPLLHLIVEVRNLSINTLPTVRAYIMQVNLLTSWAFPLHSITDSSLGHNYCFSETLHRL